MSSVSDAAMATLKKGTAKLPRARITEVVLQTARFDEQKAWYAALLGSDWHVNNEPKPSTEIKNKHGDGGKQVHASDVRASFMFLDPRDSNTVTLGLFERRELSSEPTSDPGLNHLQFRQTDFESLVSWLEVLRDAGIHPHRSANHGPITSFYFRDPDQNVVELCAANFDTRDELMRFVESPVFRANPSGVDINRDDFIQRYRNGTPKADLIKF